MNAGDLLQVTQPQACGGRPRGAIGLVLESYNIGLGLSGASCFRYLVWWSANDCAVHIGNGAEVISESR